MSKVINISHSQDVEKLIQQHNLDDSAHKDIRTTLESKEPIGAAEAALTDAKLYVDEKISQIPTPDVSAQISAHNTSKEAHANMGWITSEDSLPSTPALINADTLGGKPAKEYATIDFVEEACSSGGAVIIPASITFYLTTGGTAFPTRGGTIHLFFDGHGFYLLGDYTFNFSSLVKLQYFSINISSFYGYEWKASTSSSGNITVLQFYYGSQSITSYPSSISAVSSMGGQIRNFEGINTKANTSSITICGGFLGEGEKIV